MNTIRLLNLAILLYRPTPNYIFCKNEAIDKIVNICLDQSYKGLEMNTLCIGSSVYYILVIVVLLYKMVELITCVWSVFDSLGNARANSMTASGQCRLAALIPCAQDASHIYDCNVRLLFRLHASLPPDTLTGHRER